MSRIIACKVPDGISRDWTVDTFTVSEEDAKRDALRCLFNFCYARKVPAGTYKRLRCDGVTVMSNTPAECTDHYQPIQRACGRVLINGLGLGVVLGAMLAKDCVTHVTVIEQSEDVIALVAPTFTTDGRVKIICADAYTWQPPRGIRYDVVWHDIWDTLCEDNLPEMAKLHRKYGRRCDWQGSWGKEFCKRMRG